MKPSTDAGKIEALLTRRVVETIVADSLRKKLLSGKKLRIKFGADPTSADLHLGHAVALRKLREFQDLGHTIVFIIGDHTALIGDPSGKSKTRPMLTAKEVRANAKTYLAQVGKILDLKKTEVHKNSEWFGAMKLSGVINLAAQFTVARMIERDDFEQRLETGIDVHLHELLYPMMQAYDSVMVEADVEIGATDQRFNLLAGRDLQRKMGKSFGSAQDKSLGSAQGMPEQDVLIVGPLLVGTDGEKKMSKSLGNYVGVSDAPEEMFGKVMSIPDAIIWDWFALTTDAPAEEVVRMKTECAAGRMNPRDAKARLAREIIALYHSAKAAEKAEAAFVAMFKNKETPDDVAVTTMAAGDHRLVDVLVAAGLAASKGEAKRVIAQGGVKIDGAVVTDADAIVAVAKKKIMIQKGKRHFAAITAA